jgi:hypothetical protein
MSARELSGPSALNGGPLGIAWYRHLNAHLAFVLDEGVP